MSARADFECAPCAQTYELPVNARMCPVCQGELTRLFNAVNVTSGRVDHQFNKAVVEPALEASLAQKTAANDAAMLERRNGIRNLGAKAALGAVAADPGAAVASRSISMPMIRTLRGFGGPRPGPGSKS